MPTQERLTRLSEAELEDHKLTWDQLALIEDEVDEFGGPVILYFGMTAWYVDVVHVAGLVKRFSFAEITADDPPARWALTVDPYDAEEDFVLRVAGSV